MHILRYQPLHSDTRWFIYCVPSQIIPFEHLLDSVCNFFFFSPPLSKFDSNPAARRLLVVRLSLTRTRAPAKCKCGRLHLDSQQWAETSRAETAAYRNDSAPKRSLLFFQAGLFFARTQKSSPAAECRSSRLYFAIHYSLLTQALF